MGNRLLVPLLLLVLGQLGLATRLWAGEQNRMALAVWVGPTVSTNGRPEPVSFSEILGAGARFSVSRPLDLELFGEGNGLLGTYSFDEAIAGGDWGRTGFRVGARAFLDLGPSIEAFTSTAWGRDVEDIYADNENRFIDGEYSVATLRLGIKFHNNARYQKPRWGFYVEAGPDFIFDQYWKEDGFAKPDRFDSLRWVLGLGVAAEFWH